MSNVRRSPHDRASSAEGGRGAFGAPDLPRALTAVLVAFAVGAWVGVEARDVDESEPVLAASSSSATIARVGGERASTEVAGPTVAMGHRHACALLLDHTVACWGDNATGQLGDGTTASRSTPARVAGLSDVVEIALGDWSTCARRAAGDVWCWGANGYGQLGDGGDAMHTTPTIVPHLDDVAQIAAGRTHVCARGKDARLRCWGSNISGELGFASSSERVATPTLVPNLPGVAEVGLGWAHTCVRLVDRTVKCFGGNAHGELGDGTTTASSAPTRVGRLEDVVGLAVGAHHACVRLGDGAGRGIACWGRNTHGEIGDGTTLDRPSPVIVRDARDAIDLALGVGRSCARSRNGVVRCWGLEGFQHGPREARTVVTPTERPELVDVAQLSIREEACLRRIDGVVLCAGTNDFGEVGDGTTIPREFPVAVRWASLVASPPRTFSMTPSHGSPHAMLTPTPMRLARSSIDLRF